MTPSTGFAPAISTVTGWRGLWLPHEGPDFGQIVDQSVRPSGCRTLPGSFWRRTWSLDPGLYCLFSRFAASLVEDSARAP